ncbi:GNAT family N-acetyltransferase [Bacillus sp. NTK071]|uniref:GNAT family N-acetyltransferase n=1 Tax=Bacillus sp. NTK071 TaxID=2802175 RepID=UPI001A8D9B8F|nr:GNAT family N-acetyltransferase [Bacillus sp. NTK071]MBN8210529.1 GNAT family N-acetyltransferase [Bacillus sp. NTK071]
MQIRNVKQSDYYVISPIINEWWNGRQMADMLPKLFFDHFTSTSFVAEEDGEVIGFLIGFLSQTHLHEGYIHFVGVHPKYRGRNIGKQLYYEFFKTIKLYGRSIVRCVTSPVNKASIAYHIRMGFEIEGGNRVVNGIAVHSNYDGPDRERVVFVKKLY